MSINVRAASRRASRASHARQLSHSRTFIGPIVRVVVVTSRGATDARRAREGTMAASLVTAAAAARVARCDGASASAGATRTTTLRGGRSRFGASSSAHRFRRVRLSPIVAASSSSADDDEDTAARTTTATATAAERSKYEETSGAVKALVSGLTAIVNAVGSVTSSSSSGSNDGAKLTRKERRDARPFPSSPRDATALRDDIAREFTEAKYLWTGDINPEMYDLFCTFTDPTLSFAGLQTFETNLKNLQPVLRRLVRNSNVELYSCEIVDDGSGGSGGGSGGGGGGSVRASWRMTGDLNLPWRPRIDLTGQTTLGFMDAGVERGCLIVSDREEWGISALDAVAQLVAPFKW